VRGRAFSAYATLVERRDPEIRRITAASNRNVVLTGQVQSMIVNPWWHDRDGDEMHGPVYVLKLRDDFTLSSITAALSAHLPLPIIRLVAKFCSPGFCEKV
jgi:hypothetical protein